MINNLIIKNFRGLRDIEFPELKQINIITGKNNAGKSSVLEAVFMFFDRISPEFVAKLSKIRGAVATSNDFSGIIEHLFYNMNIDEKIIVRLNYDDVEYKLEYSIDKKFSPSSMSFPTDVAVNQILTNAKPENNLKMTFNGGGYCEEGHFVYSNIGRVNNINTSDNNQIRRLMDVRYVNQSIARTDNTTLIDYFGKIELKGRKAELLEFIRIIDPEISDLLTISQGGYTQLYVKVGESILPLHLVGDGLCNLLYIVLILMVEKNSLILIDEIESGFHYSIYSMLWKIISSISEKSNCQVIATTHSYECMAKSIEGVKSADMLNEILYYRIEKKNGINKSYMFDAEMMETAVEGDFEVR